MAGTAVSSVEEVSSSQGTQQIAASTQDAAPRQQEPAASVDTQDRTQISDDAKTETGDKPAGIDFSQWSQPKNEADKYQKVTVEKWGSGKNDCVWNALKGAGYSDDEIKNQGLVNQVAQLNNLKDPNLVHAGQELRLPRKGEGGQTAEAPQQQEAGQAETSQEAPAAANQGLQDQIMGRAKSIGGQINATGGYRFDGHNDCYGFVRRVWDDVLKGQGEKPLPVNDGPNSPNWSAINWDNLKAGDVLSTAKGHQWGDRWHGGLYAGKINGVHHIYDNSGSKSAQLRPVPNLNYFSYVYNRTHDKL
jgi:LysM repeat protein